MALPNRIWSTIQDAATLWECNVADIAGWADAGYFGIFTGIAPILSGEEIVAGKVTLAPMELLPMFRRCGTGPSEGLVRRVQPYGSEKWLMITEPADGVIVAMVDILIPQKEMRHFEEVYDVFNRVVKVAKYEDDGDYDWTSMGVEITRRIYEDGLPASQGEWIRELQDWFAAGSETGAFPDESSIRRRLTPILKVLKFKNPRR